MSLPATLLQHAEAHSCFSGCYGGDSNVQTCLDPAQPLSTMFVVYCYDCFAHLGVMSSLLPPRTSGSAVAGELSQHLRQKRGFALSFSGYHVQGPGFWASAAYVASCGLFFLSGERSRQMGSDLDLLLLSFQHKVAVPPDPRMLDPQQYATQETYIRFPLTQPLTSMRALLASPDCRSKAGSGFQRLTLAEFLPVSTAVQAASPAPPPTVATPPQTTPAAATLSKSAPSAPTPPRPLKVGDRCPKCGAEVKTRPLLNGSFVGCLC